MAEPVLEGGIAEKSATMRRRERRLVGHALSCWENSRGGRRFPTRGDLEAMIGEELTENIFLIAIGEDEAADEIIQSGSVLIEALRLNPVGKKVVNVLPSATEKGLSFCRAAAELKKPIADVGHFTNAAGEDVYYRSVLLPLSDDQENVNYLMGAFSFKSVI